MAFFYPPPPRAQGPASSTPPLPHAPIPPPALNAITGVSASGGVGTLTPVVPTVPFKRLPASILSAWWDATVIEVVTTWTIAPENPDQPPRVAPLSATAQRIARTWDVVWAAQRSIVSVAPMQPVMLGVQTTGALGTVGVSTTVTLSGVSTTTAVGIVTQSAPLTVVVATGQVGTLGTPLIDVPLSGVQTLGLVGSLSTGGNVTIAVTGVTTTGSVGTVGISLTRALTGVTTTGLAGGVSPSLVVQCSGVTTTGSAGSLTPSGGTLQLTLTGVQATGAAGTVFVFGEFVPFWDAQSNQYLCPAGRIMVAS